MSNTYSIFDADTLEILAMGLSLREAEHIRANETHRNVDYERDAR